MRSSIFRPMMKKIIILPPVILTLMKKSYLTDQMVTARYHGDLVEVSVEKIDLIDVSPRQVLGASASLIPFSKMTMLQPCFNGFSHAMSSRTFD